MKKMMMKHNTTDSASTVSSLIRQVVEAKQTSPLYEFIHFETDRKETLSYEELFYRVNTFANILRRHANRGDRVILLYPPGLDFVIAFHSCLYAGLIAVPVPHIKSGERWNHFLKVIADCEAKLICTTDEYRSVIDDLMRKESTPPAVEILSATPFDQSRFEPFHGDDPQPDDIAFLQYTSGSTGSPKGVCVSHANLLHNLETLKRVHRITEEAICCSWLPTYHDMGLIWGVLLPMFSGVHAVLMSPTAFVLNPGRWLETISSRQITHSGAPNFAYDLCVKKWSGETALDLSSWKLAYCGAEMIRKTTIDLFCETFATAGFHQNSFFPCYGLAEATLMVSGGTFQTPPLIETLLSSEKERGNARCTDGEAEKTVPVVSVGFPARCEVIIVDPDTGQALKDGEIGEIWIRGESVSRGYWEKPELNAQLFAATVAGKIGNYFRTGDTGYLREENLFITGRLKEMIILGGRNYFPTDIERVVQQAHPALRLNFGAAFSVDTSRKEELIIVQEVVRDHDAGCSEEELHGEIRFSLLKELGIEPDHLVLIEHGTLPVTSSGKIRRLQAKERYLSNAFKRIELS